MLTTGVYRNRSSNQLVTYALPTTTGFSGVLSNLGATVQNTGLEVELTTVNFQASKKVLWTTSFNITIPRNKLIEFPDIESSSYSNTYIIGRSIYIRKFYESTGVDPQTGLYKFEDLNDDADITDPADMQKPMFVGQNFYGGINNSLSYKGWKLDVFFQFVRQTGFIYSGEGLGYDVNYPAFILGLDRWRKPGDVAAVQRAAIGSDAQAFASLLLYTQSDATVGDASFIRLKNISLSYEFPSNWTNGVSTRLYFQGQNLFVITGFKGFDPETQSLSKLPPLRMFTAGLHVTL
jgi:hypothetical protein